MGTLHNQQRHRKWCVWIFRERRSVYNASTLYRGVTYQTEFDGDLFIMQQIRHRAGLRSGRFLHFLCVSCLLCFYAGQSTTPLEGLLQHFLLLWFICMSNSPHISSLCSLPIKQRSCMSRNRNLFSKFKTGTCCATNRNLKHRA